MDYDRQILIDDEDLYLVGDWNAISDPSFFLQTARSIVVGSLDGSEVAVALTPFFGRDFTLHGVPSPSANWSCIVDDVIVGGSTSTRPDNVLCQSTKLNDGNHDFAFNGISGEFLLDAFIFTNLPDKYRHAGTNVIMGIPHYSQSITYSGRWFINSEGLAATNASGASITLPFGGTQVVWGTPCQSFAIGGTNAQLVCDVDNITASTFHLQSICSKEQKLMVAASVQPGVLHHLTCVFVAPDESKILTLDSLHVVASLGFRSQFDVAPAPFVSGDSPKPRLPIIIGSTTAVLLLGVALLITFILRRRRKANGKKRFHQIGSDVALVPLETETHEDNSTVRTEEQHFFVSPAGRHLNAVLRRPHPSGDSTLPDSSNSNDSHRRIARSPIPSVSSSAIYATSLPRSNHSNPFADSRSPELITPYGDRDHDSFPLNSSDTGHSHYSNPFVDTEEDTESMESTAFYAQGQVEGRDHPHSTDNASVDSYRTKDSLEPPSYLP